MSELDANTNQNTPDAGALEAQIAADEAARHAPEASTDETPLSAEEPKDPEATDEPEEQAKDDDDFESRLAKMAKERRLAQKEAKKLREQVARLEGRAPAAPKDEEMAREIEKAADERARVIAYNNRANQIFNEGCKAFPDFDKQMQTLREMNDGISPELVEACDEIGDPHKLLHYLAKNPDEAERISLLPPHKMGASLGKISAKLAVPPQAQSKAPPPIKPISGNTKTEMSDTDMPIEEYMKKETERWANRHARRYN